MSELVSIECPYCGESFSTSADPSAGSQTYVEDCAVCCKPIVVSMEVEGDEIVSVRTRREDD